MEYAGGAPQEATQVATPQDNGAEAAPMAVDSGLTDEQQAAAHLQEQEQHIVQQHQQLPHEMQAGAGHAVDPVLQGMVHIDPNALVGVPPGLAPLQSPGGEGTSGSGGSNGKFKPIDLESLSPKSRQRVMRNRQAATRSKAKKKQQFQVLKDKKVGLATEVEQLEAQVVATQQRVAQLLAENKSLADSCKCSKE